MNTSKITLFLVSILLLGCVSHEQKMLKQYGEKPDWAKQTPLSSSYYYGVGITSKSQTNFKKAAVRSALDNLANEISVEISSASLLSTMETNGSFRQEYSQDIHLKSSEELEGYEITGSWEDETSYYTCYRLSKQVHRDLKVKKVKLALARSKTMYQSGEKYMKVNNYKQSFVAKVQALEVLIPYLNQDLSTTINDVRVNLAVKLVEDLKNTESTLHITPSFRKKELVIGAQITGQELFCTVTNNRKVTIEGIPILFEYKTITLKKHRVNTNSTGIAAYNLGKIKSHKTHQNIYIGFDFITLLEQTSSNRTLHKLINHQVPNKVSVIIEASPPSVFIKGVNNVDDNSKSPNKQFEIELQKSLLDNRFSISTNEKNANLILQYDLKSHFEKQQGNTNRYSTQGSIQVMENNKIIFSQSLLSKRGTNVNKGTALRQAYNKVSTSISKKVIPQLSNKYFGY